MAREYVRNRSPEDRARKKRERDRRYYYRNRPRVTAKRYGLPVDALDAMRSAQGGHCALCPAVERLEVDHDHATGKVRGLLCRRCNLSLGHLREDVALLGRMIEYLR